MSTTIKVIIADDHSLFADGLEQILISLPSLEVICKVGNGKELLQVINKNQPNLILLDINMPFLDGLEAAKRIKKNYPNIKIVMISMYCDFKLISNIMEEGIDGYILKDTTAPELKKAILNVLNGEKQFIFPAMEKLHDDIGVKDGFSEKYKLSSREIEIISLIKAGNTTKQIAGIVELSVFTIETHRKNIYRKLKLQGTAELIKFANDNQIV